MLEVDLTFVLLLGKKKLKKKILVFQSFENTAVSFDSFIALDKMFFLFFFFQRDICISRLEEYPVTGKCCI